MAKPHSGIVRSDSPLVSRAGLSTPTKTPHHSITDTVLLGRVDCGNTPDRYIDRVPGRGSGGIQDPLQRLIARLVQSQQGGGRLSCCPKIVLEYHRLALQSGVLSHVLSGRLALALELH
jgi:hypothetical protein